MSSKSVVVLPKKKVKNWQISSKIRTLDLDFRFFLHTALLSTCRYTHWLFFNRKKRNRLRKVAAVSNFVANFHASFCSAYFAPLVRQVNTCRKNLIHFSSNFIKLRNCEIIIKKCEKFCNISCSSKTQKKKIAVR